ncbi:hypothetical protein [Lignipirellula cremea]|uniref:Uncharacterized protein n=1 Tax=Lignipirellula cremea TaxID=2528010 RepID=A0A518DUJ3_9BACT|nr:hypothetical protein [Lignipirellula cremea]QDU95500.1 hypothetical protein Pla8534_33150 [Lignipirellula cremea]
MVKPEPAPQIISFRVQVGHTAVTVNGDSREAAIAAARTQLCDELPRLWDVILHLDADRFQVTPVPSDPLAETPLRTQPLPAAPLPPLPLPCDSLPGVVDAAPPFPVG